MIGQVKSMIEKFILEKSKGDKFIENSLRVKLILKGIDVDSYTDNSPDDPAAVQQIRDVARDFGIIL
ncbi:MAG: hypothetical protein LBS21_15320 [Clostridiales bacterium]|jgi:hypothetical protein|nr:hypothetical protein [Clostridiales bacterium]